MASSEIKVTVTADNKPFLDSLKQCTEELKKFSKVTSDIKIDTGKIEKAETAVKGLADALKAMGSGQNINVTANVTQALDALKETETAVKTIQGAKIDVSIDKEQAILDIDNIQKALSQLSSNLSNIKIDSSEITQAAQEIKNLRSANVDINVKSENATEEIKNLSESLKKLKSSKINIKADGKDAKKELQRVTQALESTHKSLKAINVKINTRQALKNLTGLISAARRLRAELKQVKLPSTGGNKLAAQLKQVAALNRQILSVMKEISAESKKISPGIGGAGRASESTLSKLGNISLIVSGAAQAFTMIKDAAAAIVAPGFDYTKEMEMNKLGIAGILQSMTLLNGQAVSFGDAMGISSDMMQKLQRDAIMTGATTEEMVTTFRALLAPGIGAGMNIDEIEEFTKVGVNAVKAMGLNSTQFVQELRDLVQGGIQASSSTLATALGLTDADIKAAKASGEGLFKFLMERMEGFRPMAEAFPNTLEGKMSQLKEMSVLASAEITKAFEDDFKNIVGNITGLIAEINAETGEFKINPAIIETIEAINDGLDEFKMYLKDLDNNDVFDWVDDGVQVLKSLGNVLQDIGGIMMDLSLVMWSITAPFRNFVWQGVTMAANEIEWLTGQIRELIDTLMVGSKVKEIRPVSRRVTDQMADASDREWQKKIGEDKKGAITSKFESKAQKEAAEKAEKERIKLAKSALKDALRYWKEQLDLIQREFKKRQEELKLLLDQDAIGSDQYYTQELQNTIENKNKELANINGQINDVQNSGIADEDKENRLENLYKERELTTADIADLSGALEELTATLGQYNTMTPEQAVRKYGLNPSGFETDSSSFLTPQSGNVDQLIYKYSQANNVEPYLVKAMVSQESGGDINALSGAGAQGIMQLMPDTAQAMGVTDPYDLEQNIMGGVKYIAQQLADFGGDVKLALAAYNAGPQAVKNHSGIPPYTETQKYVPAILAKMEELKAATVQAKVPQAGAGEGNTWYKVSGENPKYDELESNAKIALETVAKYFKELTGQAIGLTSGKRSADLGYSQSEIGGHGTGTKFDVTAEALNDPEIRRKVIEFAKSIGIQVLDEYANPTVKATGRHLDFNAANFDSKTARIPGMNMDVTGVMKSRQAYEGVKARLAVRNEAKDILQKYNEMMLGDITTYQIATIEAQYEAVRKKLSNHENDDLARSALDKIGKLIAAEKLQVRFSQTQKDLQYAYDELTDVQEDLMYELEAGIKDSTQVTEEYTAKCRELLGGELQTLQEQLNEATKAGQRDTVRDIKAKMKEAINTISEGIQAILDKIDAETNKEIEKIQMNKHLTDFQKEDAIDAVKREADKRKVVSLNSRIDEWNLMRDEVDQDETRQDNFKKNHGGLTIDQAILKAKEQLELLNYQIEQTPTLLEEVQQAGKQAFEDGLFDFLTEGIFQCESLGEAFRNLAITVLQAIQRMYAEALTKNIMNALFPANSTPNMNASSGSSSGSGFSFESGFGIDYGFAEGGHVVGEGTGTSDSILARLSNGEFVINAAAVRQVGIDTLHRINSGRAFEIPMPRFALGGYVGDRGSSIPQFAADAFSQGLGSFGSEIKTNFNPTINNNTDVRIDGNHLAQVFKGMIKADVSSQIEREMMQNAKKHSMMMKRMW